MHICVCVCKLCVGVLTDTRVHVLTYARKSYERCFGAYSVYKSVSACACICVCVCACVQLSQVCVINQLSGQFICWVTSCNFPPDSRPLCQVGITLRAHDKTLHLSASFPRFFSLPLDFASFSPSSLSPPSL